MANTNGRHKVSKRAPLAANEHIKQIFKNVLDLFKKQIMFKYMYASNTW